MHDDVIRQLFAIGGFVRWVAFGKGSVATTERPGLEGDRQQTSDQFEELFVNPAILNPGSTTG